MNKIMNFADGPKEITVGMTVVVTNGQLGSHKTVTETKVEKVGRELVTLENGRKYYLENGHQQTEYASGRIYSSKEAYELEKMQGITISKVSQELRNRHLTYEESIKVSELLGIKIK